MSFRYELKLRPRTNGSRDDPLATFYWPADGPSSFIAPFGPRLADVGAVPPLNVDLARLALLVFAADRSTIRRVGTTNWSSRDFSLTRSRYPTRSHGMRSLASWEICSPSSPVILGHSTSETHDRQESKVSRSSTKRSPPG